MERPGDAQPVHPLPAGRCGVAAGGRPEADRNVVERAAAEFDVGPGPGRAVELSRTRESRRLRSSITPQGFAGTTLGST
jgi:hypothetical protein